MQWNWQAEGWPEFSHDDGALRGLEQQFLLQSGEFQGAFRHLDGNGQAFLRVELIGEEAIKTSEIEGEILNRDSVQASLRQQMGLEQSRTPISAAERGIAEMLLDLYGGFDRPMSNGLLFSWHRMLLQENRSIREIGCYRTHIEPMQVVSGPDYRRRIHFEAPPSVHVPQEMERFIEWYNLTTPSAGTAGSALLRAGLAHLYFVSIHPFEDGNGRIGRAIAQKVLAQALGRPSLISLSSTIERRRRDYYAALERNNRKLEITDWLVYFAETIVEAQRRTAHLVDFVIARARFHDRLRGQLNERQEKVIARMFREGIDGFRGGLSAENYIAIAKTSRATATRDLQDLVEKGGLTRSGALRHTRYALRLGYDEPNTSFSAAGASA